VPARVLGMIGVGHMSSLRELSQGKTLQQAAADASQKLWRFFQRHASVIGWALLALWLVWWVSNLINYRMAFAEATWIRFPAFGVDFVNPIAPGVRTWVEGGDPYEKKHLLLVYPPIVLRLFIWAKLMPPEVSARVWICLAAACAVIGALASVRIRRQLGLANVPASFGVAVILYSTPVLFALERANYDLLIVPLVVAAVMLMRRETETADVIAAFLLAVAIWAKLYPGLLVLAVLALRRWRLTIWLAVFGALIGLADVPQLMRFLVNNNIHIEQAWALARWLSDTIHPWNHPLPNSWPALWSGTPLAWLPGQIGAALLLGAPLLWVSSHMYWSPARDRLVLPYFLWVIALGTFVPPVSNDYNLTPLPLAILAVWNRDNRWFVHVALAALLLWWQPFHFPLPVTGHSPLGGGRIFLFIKLAGLFATGAALVERAHKLSHETHYDLRRDILELKRLFGAAVQYPFSVLSHSNVADNRAKLTKDNDSPSSGKIEFHGLQLVPFDSPDRIGVREPMDINPASRWHLPAFVERYGGFFPPAQQTERHISAFDELDLARRDMLVLLMRDVIQRKVKGDFAELGVFRGATAKLFHHYAPERQLHLFDTFVGFDDRDLQAEPKGNINYDARGWFGDTNMAEAKAYIAPLNKNVHFYPGFFPESVPAKLKRKRFAFVHLDVDLYTPTYAGLEFFYRRLSRGGILVIHDYNAWLGTRQAVDKFFADKAETPLPMPDRSGSAVIVKQ